MYVDVAVEQEDDTRPHHLEPRTVERANDRIRRHLIQTTVDLAALSMDLVSSHLGFGRRSSRAN